MKKTRNTVWLTILALSLIFLPNLKAQDGLKDYYMPMESLSPVSTVSKMIATPLSAPGVFRDDVANMMEKSQFSIPKPDFSLTREPQTPQTDASRYFQHHFRSHKWENTLFDATLVAHAALNIADYFSTREALKYPGLQEGNPLLKPFVKNDFAFAALKIGLTTGNHFLLKSIYKKNKTLGWIVSLTSNFLLSYVVVHNFEMIEQARH